MLLLLASCASAPRPPEAARVPDAAPEKIAAQRAGAPRSLGLEQSDERWGFEAARERRRQQDAAKAKQAAAEADKSVGVTNPPAR